MGRTRFNLRRRNNYELRDLAMGKNKPKRHKKKGQPEVTVEPAQIKCSICWEGCSTDDHQPCAMKSCGHVFGKRCIYKWMAIRLVPMCPLCNEVIRPTDVLPLYIEFQEQDLASLTDKIAKLELQIRLYKALRRAWPKGREGEEEAKRT